MRLVDADEAYKVLTDYYHHRTEIQHKALKEAIERVPTIDAVPVVRCKDCEYMTEHYDTDGNVPYWTCSEWDSGTDYDGYCHYGKRREDDYYSNPRMDR